MEGKTISWKAANGIREGIIIGKFFRKRDNTFLGYLTQLANGKKVIVHPNSIIHAEATEQKPQ